MDATLGSRLLSFRSTLVRSSTTAVALLAMFSAPVMAQGALDVLETQYVLPPDINPYQEFGTALDVDGDTLIVGSPSDEDYGLNSGSAYVFVRSNGAWVLEQKLHSAAPTPNQNFGTSVAVSGDIAIVGEPRWCPPGQPYSFYGTVHIYRRSAGVWNLETQLFASDLWVYWHFGQSVGIQGERIVVGAPQYGPGQIYRGAVYVFEFTGGTWTQTALVHASDAAYEDHFGEHVALSGDTILAAAPGHGSGVAYALVRDNGGTWNEQAILVPPNLGAGGVWCDSLAFEGDVAVMGNWRHGVSPAPYQGRALVWRRSGSAWSVESVLSPGVVPGYTGFAFSVAIHAERIAVGAPGRVYYGTNGHVGEVRVFVRHAGVWTEESRVHASTGTDLDELGNSVAWHGNELVTGAWHRWEWGIDSGAVYSCDLDQRAHTYCAALPNSAGPGAWISAIGTLSVSANDFTLACSGLPPGSLGKFFYGTGQANAPFGNGLRCVGGSTFRLYPAVPADSTGSVTRHVDFTQAPSGIGPGAITPGSTWYFQYWHRNAAAGGAGFNLSDGFAATFAP